jgi:hypothetical protein
MVGLFRSKLDVLLFIQFLNLLSWSCLAAERVACLRIIWRQSSGRQMTIIYGSSPVFSFYTLSSLPVSKTHALHSCPADSPAQYAMLSSPKT